ncbi:MAG TPA: retropepsin-like aspartic protease [Stellaceae bacterium]|nr:retropepsin-like aspartic protease [Stellaceae bacterium]
MRLAPFHVLLSIILIGSHVAIASDEHLMNCSGVSLPSSIVICSSPELRRLADERQRIYNETRARLKPEQQAALHEDQKTWVHSYAAVCGVPPNKPPPNSIPPTVIECFKRAAETRAVYLRNYGLNNDASNLSSQPTATSADKSLTTREIPLEQAGGGLLEVHVQINGLVTLPFIIDSGASTVQITPDVFLTLIRTNTIRKEDITGYASFRMADGNSQKYAKFIIRDLKVGPFVLHNVSASVAPFVRGSLLLGQSFLSQFDSWALDNRRHVLKLAGNTIETPRETASSHKGGPVALIAPAAPSHDKLWRQTALVCGKPVAYSVGSANRRSRFEGVWTGYWNNSNRLCGGLIVEDIEEDGASTGPGTRAAADVIYIYGPSRPGSHLIWKQQHVEANLSTNVLSFKDEQGGLFRFYLDDPDTLEARFTSGLTHLRGVFQKSR